MAGSAKAVCKLTPAAALFHAANNASLQWLLRDSTQRAVDLVMLLCMFTLPLCTHTRLENVDLRFNHVNKRTGFTLLSV